MQHLANKVQIPWTHSSQINGLFVNSVKFEMNDECICEICALFFVTVRAKFGFIHRTSGHLRQLPSQKFHSRIGCSKNKSLLQSFHTLQNIRGWATKKEKEKCGGKPWYFSVILLFLHRLALLCWVYRMTLKVVSVDRQPVTCSSVSPAEQSTELQTRRDQECDWRKKKSEPFLNLGLALVSSEYCISPGCISDRPRLCSRTCGVELLSVVLVQQIVLSSKLPRDYVVCPKAHDEVPVHGVAVLQREGGEVLEEEQWNDKVLTVPHFERRHGKNLVYPQELGILWRQGERGIDDVFMFTFQ